MIVNEDGDLFLVGRQKVRSLWDPRLVRVDLRHRSIFGPQSVFKVRGFQVSGDELESMIRNHPDVDEVCVVGAPDLYSGEVPVALVVLGDEARERAEKDDKEMKKITISILKARSVTNPQYEKPTL